MTQHRCPYCNRFFRPDPRAVMKIHCGGDLYRRAHNRKRLRHWRNLNPDHKSGTRPRCGRGRRHFRTTGKTGEETTPSMDRWDVKGIVDVFQTLLGHSGGKRDSPTTQSRCSYCCHCAISKYGVTRRGSFLWR
jgi:hypothetical protein